MRLGEWGMSADVWKMESEWMDKSWISREETESQMPTEGEAAWKEWLWSAPRGSVLGTPKLYERMGVKGEVSTGDDGKSRWGVVRPLPRWLGGYLWEGYFLEKLDQGSTGLGNSRYRWVYRWDTLEKVEVLCESLHVEGHHLLSGHPELWPSLYSSVPGLAV